MQAAQTDNDFAAALGAINKVVKIDPERVEDVFDTAQDILGEQVDADRFWDKLYGKEMEGATGALEDHIPTMEDLSRQLEQEVAAEVGGATAPARAGEAIDSRVAAGQERVKKLLEGR
jgi:antitoxin component HigA of HigAB toxin-antitoxin module